MTTHIPHRLVHAHLPAPPSLHTSIPTLQIPSDRPFPTTDDVSEPIFPGHALSFAYEPSLNVLARVIHNGYTLELRPLDTVISTIPSTRPEAGSDTIWISFPDALRPVGQRTFIVSELDRRVYILLVTEVNVLYRLNFPLGNAKVGQPGSRFSFTIKGNKDWAEEWQIPLDILSGCGQVTALTVVDDQNVVLGGADGGIVRLQRSSRGLSGQWSAQHHKVSYGWGLSMFSSSSEHSVIALDVYGKGDNTALYTLSRDRKIRTWNPYTGSLLRSTDVEASSSRDLVLRTSHSASSSASRSGALPENTSVPLIKVIPHPSAASQYSHLVVTFLASPEDPASPGTFVVYRVAKNDFGPGELVYAGEKTCSLRSASYEIRGFDVLPPIQLDERSSGSWTLWVTWDDKSHSISESIAMDDIFQFTNYLDPSQPLALHDEWQRASKSDDQDAYDTAYFDNILSLDPPEPTEPYANGDIADVFIQHLFFPGRFSQLALTTALEEHIAGLPRQQALAQVSQSFPSLSAKFEKIVGCDIVMSLDPSTGAVEVQEYRAKLKLSWLGVWSRVKTLNQDGRWPLGTAKIDDQYMVVSREGFSMAVPEDDCASIERAGGDDEYRLVASTSSNSSMLVISTAGSHLASTLSSAATPEGIDALSAFTAELDNQLGSAPTVPIETLLDGLWDDYIDPAIEDEGHTALRRILSECDDVEQGLIDLLNTINQIDSPWNLDRLESLHLSGLGNALLASNIAQTISSRFQLARKILLVAIFAHIEASDDADRDPGTFLRILSQASVAYHRSAVLNWVAEQTAEEADTRRTRKTKRRIGENTSPEEGEDADGYMTTYSLLHSLLAGSLRKDVSESPLGVTYTMTSTLLQGMWSVDVEQTDLEPNVMDVQLAHTVLVDGHPRLAGTLADMYPSSAGTCFVKGKAYMGLGQDDEAVEQLQKAAAGWSDPSLLAIVPQIAGQGGLTQYYRHVTQLFEDHGMEAPIVHFGQLALNCTRPEDPAVKDVWTKVFLANLSLGRYEDAYAVLSQTPDFEAKRDFLGQLISHMCEANEVGRMNDLGFVGLQKDVAELLAFKARHSDPLRSPNYYKVLYSWHVTRGDFRSAGSIMYDQAKRLGHSVKSVHVSAFEITAMQARSYLAAINALSLLEKRLAWLAIPAPLERASRAVKRRRVSSYVPESEFAADAKALDIVTLADIQAEYTAVLSQLQLTTEDPDVLGEGRITIEPPQLVGMFIQRSMYDQAQSAASAFGIDMTELFISLAQRCVQLSRLANESHNIPSANFLYSSPVTSRLRGPPAALALRYLQSALQRHDSVKTQWRYRTAVTDELFRLNVEKNGWQMPVWLVEWEMKRDPEGWISKALEHGWVAEAIEWTSDYLRQATPPELLAKGKSDVAYTAFNIIDRVLAASKDGTEKDDEGIQQKARRLREASERRILGLKKHAGV